MKKTLLLITALLFLGFNTVHANSWELLPYAYKTNSNKTYGGKIFASHDDKFLIAGLRFDGGPLDISFDGGNKWQPIFSWLRLMAVKYGPDGKMYIIPEAKYGPDSLFSSSDGITWLNHGFKVIGGEYERDFAISKNNTLLFPMSGYYKNGTLDKSTDDGLTWTNLAGNMGPIACSYSADTIVQSVVSPWPGGVQYSHDGGATFTLTTGPAGGALPICLDNGDIYAATLSEIWKSTDGGKTYTKFPIPFNIGQVQEFFYAKNGKFYIRVSGAVKGIWETEDFVTFGSLTVDFVDYDKIDDLDFSDQYAYIVTSEGKLYRQALSFANAVKENKVASALGSIYPNPATDVLHFKLNQGKTIDNVALYDYSGRLLLSQTNHSTELNVSKLVPGVYFLRVYVDGYLQQEKVILY